jgi:hypothetical protein
MCGQQVSEAQNPYHTLVYLSRCAHKSLLVEALLLPFSLSLSRSTMGSIPEDDDMEAPKQRTQPHLMPQNAETVDATKLTALSPEVVRRTDHAFSSLISQNRYSLTKSILSLI